MKHSHLIVAFASTALAACASSYEPYIDTFSDWYPPPGTLAGEFQPRSRIFYDPNRPIPPLERLVGPGVRILNYQTATPEEKAACTKIINEPSGHLRTHRVQGPYTLYMRYDINQHGQTVNIEIVDRNESNSIQINRSIPAVRNTLFENPVLNGERLYCRNVHEQFFWLYENFGRQYYGRSRDVPPRDPPAPYNPQLGY